MQPYFLPYIGYFQLIKSVDIFVYYDDVTFIKQSWINRNRILLNNRDYLFSLELKESSSYKNINNIEIGNNRNKLLNTFIHAYKKAPFFNEVESILYTIFESQKFNLSNFIIDSNLLISKYLGLNTTILLASEIEKDINLKGQDKVIDICKNLNANSYFNSSGGIELYSKKVFANHGIELFFVHPRNMVYQQFNDKFIPWLSIIDVMMFNSPEKINDFITNYDLR